MENFIGLSGLIQCPSNLGIMIKSVQADVNDASVTNVGVTISGVGTGTSYDFNAITPVLPDIRLPYQAQASVTSSGSLRNVVIGYVYYGDMKNHMRINTPANTIPIPWRFRT